MPMKRTLCTIGAKFNFRCSTIVCLYTLLENEAGIYSRALGYYTASLAQNFCHFLSNCIVILMLISRSRRNTVWSNVRNMVVGYTAANLLPIQSTPQLLKVSVVYTDKTSSRWPSTITLSWGHRSKRCAGEQHWKDANAMPVACLTVSVIGTTTCVQIVTWFSRELELVNRDVKVIGYFWLESGIFFK